jgi:hypothetical protein
MDAWRDVVFVFRLGVCECGFVGRIPEDGLETTVDIALLAEAKEGLDDFGFEGGGHREVWMVPVAADAEALELCLLCGYPASGVFAATCAEGVRRPLDFFLTELFDDGDFDRQAMVVPAGDVGRFVTGHRFIFNDDVLEGFIERVPEVDVAI